MKIIVMSDSHGLFSAVQKVVQLHADADMFIHLGDGEREMSRLLHTDPTLADRLYYLKGNCDMGTVIPGTQRSCTIALPFGHKIFAAHGDMFQVKFGTARIAYEARQAGADIVLYGHTHVRDCRYEDGLYILDPGSLGCPRDGGKPSYALISVSEKGILTNIALL